MDFISWVLVFWQEDNLLSWSVFRRRDRGREGSESSFSAGCLQLFRSHKIDHWRKMSISRQQVEVQVPKTSSTHTRGNGHDDESPSPSPPFKGGMHQTYKKAAVRYRECQKNHAASMGGNARDGCGEFMASGEEGTLEALKCSACSCHRNFHRKETEGEFSYTFGHLQPLNNTERKLILGHHNKPIMGTKSIEYPTGTLVSSRAAAPQHMIMGSIPSESDEQEEIGRGGPKPSSDQQVKKRFRTKFTQEQKEKMLSFAERAGWRIQKQEESLVQQFCQEIGIKRRVLKVWMHNNKNLARKNPSTDWTILSLSPL